MTMQVGLRNGQPVAYDPSDPLSSYGVQPATVTPSGGIVATGPAAYSEVPHPGGGITTYVSPSGEATQLAQGGPVYGTVQMPFPTSQPTQEEQIAQQKRQSDIDAIKQAIDIGVVMSSQGKDAIAVTPEEYRKGKLQDYGMLPFTALGTGAEVNRETIPEGVKITYEPSVYLAQPQTEFHPRDVFKMMHPEMTEPQLQGIESKMQSPAFQTIEGIFPAGIGLGGASELIGASVNIIKGENPLKVQLAFKQQNWLEQAEAIYQSQKGDVIGATINRMSGSIITAVSMAGLKFAPTIVAKILPHAPVSALPYLSPLAGKIAILGLTGAATTYGMIQMREAIPEIMKSGINVSASQQFGSGLITAGFGALGIYGSWKALFPPQAQYSFSVAEQRAMIDEQAMKGVSQADVKGTVNLGSATYKIEMTSDSGFSYDAKGKMAFISEASGQYQAPKTGWSLVKSYFKGEPTWEWKPLKAPVQSGWGIVQSESMEFKTSWTSKSFIEGEWANQMYGVVKGTTTVKIGGKPVEVQWKGLTGKEAETNMIPKTLEPRSLTFGKTDISYISHSGSLKSTPKGQAGSGGKLFYDFQTKPDKMIGDFSSMLAEQKTLKMESAVSATTDASIKNAMSQMSKTFTYNIKEPSMVFIPSKDIQEIKTKNFTTIDVNVPNIAKQSSMMQFHEKDIVSNVPITGLADFTKEIQRNFQGFGFGSFSAEVPKETQITKQLTVQTTKTFPGFFTPTNIDIIIPKIDIPFPPLSFGSSPEGFVPRRRSRYFKSRQPYGYLPSMGAVLMGIRGSMPKSFGGMLTGLEMRPLVSSRRRKKKRKR